jgi:hypothetical protein
MQRLIESLGFLKRLLMFVGLSQTKRFAKNCASNIYPPKADHGNPRDSEAVTFVVFKHWANSNLIPAL